MKPFSVQFFEIGKNLLLLFVLLFGGYIFFSLFFEIAEIQYRRYEIRVSFNGKFEREKFTKEFPQKLQEISPSFDTRLDLLWWPGQVKPFYQFVLRFTEPIPTVSQNEKIVMYIKEYLTNANWHEISVRQCSFASQKNIRLLSFFLSLFFTAGLTISFCLGGLSCKK